MNEKPWSVPYYLDDMVAFERDGKRKVFELANTDISRKQMQLGIPYNTTPEQMAGIAQSIQYAKSQGIQIVVTRIK